MIKKLLLFIFLFIFGIIPACAANTNITPEQMTLSLENGLHNYCYSNACVTKQGDKYGLKTGKNDTEEKEYLPPVYDIVFPVDKQGLWLLKKDNQFGLYLKAFNKPSNGRFLLDCVYDEISEIGNLGFKVKKGSKYAFFGSYDILSYGTYLTKFVYDDILLSPKGKYITVIKNGKEYDKNTITTRNKLRYARTSIMDSRLWEIMY